MASGDGSPLMSFAPPPASPHPTPRWVARLFQDRVAGVARFVWEGWLLAGVGAENAGATTTSFPHAHKTTKHSEARPAKN